MEFDDSNITIFSDSQAALLAVSNHIIAQKSVADCANALNTLSITRNVELKWVKAHFNYVGNEFADMQAKQGTMNNENRVFLPPPLSWARHRVKLGIDEIWSERFKKSPGLNQTKFWLSKNEKKVTNYLLNLSRKDLGLMIQIITGHCFLK